MLVLFSGSCKRFNEHAGHKTQSMIASGGKRVVRVTGPSVQPPAYTSTYPRLYGAKGIQELNFG